VQRPLATVVIGGLVSSTLLTLLVLPTVYAWLEEWCLLHAMSVSRVRTIDAAQPATEAS
jgi:AcrB/AcrD/AcrF family protein